ncbi:hypothetical protein [Nocardioides aquiterrae]|uniref:Thiopeptide-type bacteriocin biosynthesis domain-containing protein n=1 Tax=Nocardioides aquiterrae TaxID=203799 RepID=A0ABN1UAG5_9ACTN
MPYSVLGGPALGFDLARLSGGEQVAGVLRAALAATPDELALLAARHPGRTVWNDWWQACADASVADASVPPDEGDLALLRRLETGMLGDAHALDRLVRSELLDWTWLHAGPVAVQDPVAGDAADVLVAAAAAGYLRDRLPADLRRAMGAPFVRAGLPAPEGTEASSADPVGEVLTTIASADEDARRRWRSVVDALRVHTAQWAPAMHQATWALSLSDRLRLGLDVHLAGVVAFRRGGFTPRDAAYGVWNAVAGVLQARVVGDLLPSAEADVLLRPWRAVHASPSA